MATRDISTFNIEGDWATMTLPAVNGKLPSRLFLYWGYVNINNETYSDVQGLILLKDFSKNWILLAKMTRVLALYD